MYNLGTSVFGMSGWSRAITGENVDSDVGTVVPRYIVQHIRARKHQIAPTIQKTMEMANGV
jgi:hypothetical protein